MSQAYAYQVLAVAVAMSVITLAGVVIASRIFDRNTRKAEAEAHARKGD